MCHTTMFKKKKKNTQSNQKPPAMEFHQTTSQGHIQPTNKYQN